MYARTNPLHPKRNKKGLYPLHRVLMENNLGRLLTKKEVIHHIDENKENNVLSNLKVMSNVEHIKHHRKVTREIIRCSFCKRNFTLRRKEMLHRLKTNKRGLLFCSRSCGSTRNKN